jgi:hypothetical protein
MPEGPAIASYLGPHQVIGLAVGNQIQVSGLVDLENLIIESVYYLGHHQITATPPTSGWLVEIGIAWSTTQLALRIRRPIKL